MTGMRDKVSHDYFGVSLLRVFETASEDLPILRPALIRVLQDLDQNREA